MNRMFIEAIVLRAFMPGATGVIDEARNALMKKQDKANEEIHHRIGEDMEEAKFIAYGLTRSPDSDAHKISFSILQDLLKENNLDMKEILERGRLNYGNNQ